MEPILTYWILLMQEWDQLPSLGKVLMIIFIRRDHHKNTRWQNWLLLFLQPKVQIEDNTFFNLKKEKLYKN